MQLLEAKLLLCGGGHFKRRSFQSRSHNSGLHGVKRTARSKGIEEVVRIAELIAACNQSIDVRYFLTVRAKGRAKSCYNCIRYEPVSIDRRNGPGRRDLIADTIKHDHLAVQIHKRTESKVSMVQ